MESFQEMNQEEKTPLNLEDPTSEYCNQFANMIYGLIEKGKAMGLSGQEIADCLNKAQGPFGIRFVAEKDKEND